MNKEKQKIVPELRFKDFQSNKEWKSPSIQNLIDNEIIISHLDGNHGALYPRSEEFTEKGVPYVTANDFVNGYVDFSNSKRLPLERARKFKKGVSIDGDILFAHNATVGPVAKLKTDLDFVILSTTATYFRCDNIELINDFLKFSLSSSYFVKQYSRVMSQSTRNQVPITTQRKFFLFLPTPEEQQKIANCLSSLDHLITAETEKLDYLKDHKKGLLQQLFPAIGETKPQYRFPEFENDGDWIETTLDDVADYENGKAHEKEISEIGKYKVVNSKFISTNGEVVKFTNSANLKANIGDVLMVLSDIPNGKAIAKCFYVDKEDTYTVNQRICKITPTGIDNKFLFYIQNRNKYFLAFDDGVKQTNLRKDTVLSFPFLKPKSTKEQQKIANCLSSADDLIQVQKTKIKNLKNHKKGLLQQLFPNVNEL